MKNAVIITAKGNNESVENKNLIPINGVPVVCYPIRAAKQSYHTDAVFISTEDPKIKDIALKEGIQVIDRPEELSRPDSMHKDVIEHATQYVDSMNEGLENVVVLLGNTAMIIPTLIDKCLEILDTTDHDSCLTAWRAQDDHPYRALQVGENGYVKSFMNATENSNRQSYPDVFFYDQGVWAFKKECAAAKKGPAPWVWLGEKCKLVERDWVTGRDIHGWIDIAASNWYLNSIQSTDFVEFQG